MALLSAIAQPPTPGARLPPKSVSSSYVAASVSPALPLSNAWRVHTRLPDPGLGSRGGSQWAAGKCPRGRLLSTVAMGLKAVENFDTSFDLNPEAREALVFLLSSETFLQQVATQPGVPPGKKVQFSGDLFQPVPWSPATKHGMPEEFEKFFHDKENYVIINVPPNFMFKAQIFKPSRLCAIFKIVGQVG